MMLRQQLNLAAIPRVSVILTAPIFRAERMESTSRPYIKQTSVAFEQ